MKTNFAIGILCFVLLGCGLAWAEPPSKDNIPVIETDINPRHYVQMFYPDDPLFVDQWHLNNDFSAPHINVVPAWTRGITGAGVIIGTVDGGVQITHPDLAPNYEAPDSRNFGSGFASDPSPQSPYEDHGTAVAGLAVARGGNGTGVTGVAPKAGLAALRIDFENQTTDMFVNATLYHSSGDNTNIKIKNHSYGFVVPYIDTPLELNALRISASAGTIHIVSAGNERGDHGRKALPSGPWAIDGDANKQQLQNSTASIAVAALGDHGRFAGYSSWGANIFVTAPSSGGARRITTTKYAFPGIHPIVEYTDDFGGTSASSSIVAGVMALGKQVNPAMDVRMAKHLLVKTSDIVDPFDSTTASDGGWKTNAAGNTFNQNYGFGLINADAFTTEAARYTGVSPLVTESTGPIVVDTGIPDAVINDTIPGMLSSSFDLFIPGELEEIEIYLDIDHSWRGDLQATLMSPSGMSSRLMLRNLADAFSDLDWSFTTNAFWGEDPLGTWSLTVEDWYIEDTGFWNSFSVQAHTGILVPEPTSLTLLGLSGLLLLVRRRRGLELRSKRARRSHNTFGVSTIRPPILSILVSLFVFSLCICPDPVLARNTTVAAKGDQVPGMTVGTYFDTFNGDWGYPVINAQGQVAFSATLNLKSNNSGVWVSGADGLTLIARAGDQVPGEPTGVKFAGFENPWLNDSGQIVFRGSLELGSGGVDVYNDGSIWTSTPGGLATIAREGDHAPGTPEGTVFGPSVTLGWGNSRVAFNDSGEMIFRADLLTWFDDGTNSWPNFDGGIWSGTPGDLTLIARYGDQAPGVPLGARFANGPNHPPSINAGGQIAFVSNLQAGSGGVIQYENDSGIWMSAPGSSELLLAVRRGDPAPGMPSGTNFDYLGDVRLNDAGQIAFGANTDDVGPGGLKTNGIWVGTHDNLTLVAYGGGPAPGLPGAHFRTDFPSVPAFNGSGQVAFQTGLEIGSGGVTESNNTGIWAGEAGNLIMIAREGDHAPGAPEGAKFGDLRWYLLAPVLNDTGQVAFGASLEVGPGGVTGLDDSGIWISDLTGECILAVRKGDTLAGRTTSGVSLYHGEGTQDGRHRIMNDFGQIVYEADFVDSGGGVFLYTPDLRWRAAEGGSWDNNLNWTLSLDPALVHDVTIDPDSGLTVTGPSSDGMVRSLALGSGAGSARLELRAGVSLTVTEGLDIAPNGTLSGSGIVIGDVTNDGLLDIGSSVGEITIDGDFVDTGMLRIEVDSLTSFDMLTVTGDAQLDGLVELAFNFTPSQIGIIQFLDAGSISSATADFTVSGIDPSMIIPDFINGRFVLTPEPGTLLLGDANCDGVVSADDYAFVQTNFGNTGVPGIPGDANGDGLVSTDDYASVQLNFGDTTGLGSVPVPEPATLSLLVIGGLGLIPRRRQQRR